MGYRRGDLNLFSAVSRGDFITVVASVTAFYLARRYILLSGDLYVLSLYYRI